MSTWRDDKRVKAAGVAVVASITAYAEAVASAVLAEQPCRLGRAWREGRWVTGCEAHEADGDKIDVCPPCAERAKRKEAP